jgi:periplasmic protein CpxP/Spy
MKKQFLLLATALLVGTTTIYAQGGFQRQTPEERLKPIHEKIDSAFKLTAEKLAKVDSIFLESFKQQEAKMAELRSGGDRPDREAMMAMRQQLADERDNKLKAILTEEQMKTWKNEIEPSLRPQRGGGNRGGGN